MTAVERLHAFARGSEPINWVMTGDSITQGVLHTRGLRSYAEHLHEWIHGELQRLGDVVINTGVSGNQTRDLVQDLDRRVFRFQPHVVTLMLGTNDATNAVGGLARFGTQLAEIADAIIDRDVVLVLQTPPPIVAGSELDRTDLAGYVDVVREVAAKRDVILADHFRHWLDGNGGAVPVGWLDDPIHPNGAGHLEIALTLLCALGFAPDQAGIGAEAHRGAVTEHETLDMPH